MSMERRVQGADRSRPGSGRIACTCLLVLSVLSLASAPASAQSLPGDLLIGAGRALDAEQWQDALALYQRLIEQHPLHEAVPLAHFASGECLLNLGRYEEALNSYQTVVDEYPDWSDANDARFRVGNCLFQLGRYTEAASALAAVLKASPTGDIADKAAYWLGEAHYHAGDNAAALDAYRQSLDMAPEGEYAPYALYSIATIQSATDLEQTIVTCTRLLEQFPDYQLVPDALYLMGQSFEALGRLEQAGAAYARVLAEHGDGRVAPYASAGMASVVFARGEYAEAASRYLEIADAYPDNEARCVWILRAGDALLAAGDYDDAIEAYARVADCPDHQRRATATYMTAVAHEAASRDQAAIAAFEQLLGDHPTDPRCAEVNLRLGALYYNDERLEQALTAYRAAAAAGDETTAREARYGVAWTAYRIDGDEQHLRGLIDLFAEDPGGALAARGALPSAEMALGGGEYEIALEFAQLLLTSHPNHPARFAAWLAAGQAHRGLGNRGEARAAFNSALEIDSTAARGDLARLGLALVALDAGETSTAEALLEAIAPTGPASDGLAQLLCLLGDAYYAEQQYAQAAEKYLSAAERADNEWTAPATLGAADALFAAGRHEAAVAQYTRFLEDEPAGPTAAQARVQLGIALANLGDYPEAVRALEAGLADITDAPWLPQALMELASAQAHAGNARAAVSTYARVADEHPGSEAAPEALFWAGELRYEQGNYPRAAEFYQRIIDNYGGCDLCHAAAYKLAWALLKTDRADDALPHLLAAAEGSENPAIILDARLQAGYILMRRQDYTRALAVLEPAARLDAAGAETGRPAALYLLGRAHLATGAHAEAATVLESAVAQYPQAAYADRSRVALARSYHLGNKLTEAEALLQPLLAAAERHVAADANFEMGELRRAQQRFAEAAALYAAAATLTEVPEIAASALFFAGVSHEQAGQARDAVSSYTRLIDEYPGKADWVARARERLTAIGATGR